MITAQMVKELWERTGAGMLDCKKRWKLQGETLKRAIDELSYQGTLAKAAKKAGRIAAKGPVTSYIHGGGRLSTGRSKL